MPKRNKLIQGAIAVAALAAAAFGADTTGRIMGNVKDPAGNPIPHTIATLANRSTGVKQTVQTGDQGSFAFPVVPVGIYELVVVSKDFEPYKRPDIVIDIGSALQLEVVLNVAGELNHNPRNGQPYFNTSLFSPNALGTQGNSARRPFHGPGMDNYDLALHNTARLTESKTLELRFETFNAFNHTQFFGAGSVDGNISSSTFGSVTHAAPPRVSQLSAKFTF
jgi:hypothetical protein